MSRLPHSALLEPFAHHLREQGLSTAQSGHMLLIEINDARLELECQVFHEDAKKDSVVIELESTLRLDPRSWGAVVQFNVGWHQDTGSAYVEAIHGWLDYVWPAIGALYDAKLLAAIGPAMRLTTTTGTEPPISWRILVGPPLIRSAEETLKGVQAELGRHPPLTLIVSALADAVNQGRLWMDGRPNWGHLFASRINGQAGSHEATIRGEPWPEAVDGLLNFRWPDSNAFMTFRQFYLVQAVDPAVPPSGADAKRGLGFFKRLKGKH